MASSVVYRRNRALLIGVNKYRRDPLQYCVNDAEDLSTNLRFIDFDITLELNCAVNQFYKIIDRFVDTIQHDDLVLFYFAGHGKQSEDENYLLPLDYDYNFRSHERDYITKHAINVQYIMKKIDDKMCCVTIYIFDCCRDLIKTRAKHMKQGLSPMHTPPKIFDRNGIFIENLLKYIAKSNHDIEDIMRNVACDVNSQRGGFQLPYRISSLIEKFS
ncbi:unnamed protein product [Rotaria sp. Silwood1]|nr:unnamed protein product [Rotaria sp. Silwood1]